MLTYYTRAKKYTLLSFPFILAFTPLVSHAQEVAGILNRLNGVVRSLLPLLLSVVTIVFIWGVITTLVAGGDMGKRKKGRDIVLYGLIGLFVIISTWGLVALLANTFGLPSEGEITRLPGAPAETKKATGAEELIGKILAKAINPFISLLFAVATVIFIWGVIEFIAHADDTKKRADGGRHILWGLIGMAIMVSFRGIILLLQNFVNSIR